MIFLALIYLAFISLGLPDSLLGSSWPLMHLSFGVPVGSAGFLAIIVSTGTILSSLLSHRLIRRFGTGAVMVGSVSLTAVALLGTSLAPSFWMLVVLAIPMGIGAGAVDSGLNAFVAKHYAAKHMNWLHCFWGVGAMLGPILISALTKSGFGWRSGYFSIAMLQVALVALLLFSLPMWRQFEPRSAQETTEKKAKRAPLLAPLRAAGAKYAMATFFLYVTVENSFILWGASYLVKVKDNLPEDAAGWVSLFFVGITVGRALSGILSTKLDSEKLIRLGIFLVLGGIVVLLLPLPAVVAPAALLLIGFGLAPIFPAMLHLTPVYFSKEDTQASMGLQMACAYTGSTLMPPLFGQIFAHTTFALMPVFMLVGSAGLLLCTTWLAQLSKKQRAAEQAD
ncbi:MAG: MFS transporter [Pygmaiobacter sp.]|nr:MFS transporter [Pygmaiobacter sp.]